jgi:hypothetical protein
MTNKSIKVGDVVTCAETGREFTIAQDGCTFNYATNEAGQVFSDEGVNIRARRGLLDRSSPFGCYLSSDGKTVTGWKGDKLGDVIASSVCKLPGTRRTCEAVRVRDVHGAEWYGRAQRGMFINLRPRKAGAK